MVWLAYSSDGVKMVEVASAPNSSFLFYTALSVHIKKKREDRFLPQRAYNLEINVRETTEEWAGKAGESVGEE